MKGVGWLVVRLCSVQAVHGGNRLIACKSWSGGECVETAGFYCRCCCLAFLNWIRVHFFVVDRVVVMQTDKQNCAIIRSITMVTASTSTHLWASGLIQSGRRRSLSVWSTK